MATVTAKRPEPRERPPVEVTITLTEAEAHRLLEMIQPIESGEHADGPYVPEYGDGTLTALLQTALQETE